jgi:hypothetical protein
MDKMISSDAFIVIITFSVFNAAFRTIFLGEASNTFMCFNIPALINDLHGTVDSKCNIIVTIKSAVSTVKSSSDLNNQPNHVIMSTRNQIIGGITINALKVGHKIIKEKIIHCDFAPHMIGCGTEKLIQCHDI